MNTFRWILVTPLALLAFAGGSLLGSVVVDLYGNQSAADIAAAFLACFCAPFVAGLVAPSRRTKTSRVVASILAVLAILGVVLTFVSIDGQPPDTSFLRRFVVPVAQLLGVLYATFLLPPFVVPGAKLEDLFRELAGLGSVVVMLGVLITLTGVLTRLFAGTWRLSSLGLAIALLGIATWLAPHAAVFLRMRRLRSDDSS